MKRMASRELKELRKRVDGWRQEQGRRALIPETFWNEAARVAQIDGVHATARALRFRYDRLKQRCGEPEPSVGLVPRNTGEHQHGQGTQRTGEAGTGVVAREEARFVALDMASVTGGGGRSRTVIEVEGRHGNKLRVDTTSGVDVVGLVQTFWSCAS